MKRLLLILPFLVSIAYGQTKTNQYLGGPNTSVINRGEFRTDSGFIIPADTTLWSGADRTRPRLAVKGTKLFRWEPSNYAWIEVGTASTTIWGDVTGTLSNQTDLQAVLDGKQDTITLGTSDDYFAGDLTVNNFQSSVLSITDPLYAPIGDTLKKIHPHEPLYYSDSDSTHLWIDGTLAYYNANRFMGVELDASMASPTDGDVPMYDAASGKWIPQPMAGAIALAVNRQLKSGAMFASSTDNLKIIEAMRMMFDMIQKQQQEINQLKKELHK